MEISDNIRDYSSTYPFVGSNGYYYTAEGKISTSDASRFEQDLLTEVVDVESSVLPTESTEFLLAWDAQAKRLHVTARDKGFYSGGVKPIDYMLNWMHSELGEVFTALQKGNPESDKIKGYSQVEEELADVVILIMDTARAHGLRVAEAVLAKDTFNQGRPYKHGKVL